MKKFKTTLLSVLLFSFVFFVVHDYAMAQVDSSHNYTPTLATSSIVSESDCATLNMETQMHESIHIMIARDIETESSSILILDNKPSDVEVAFATHKSFILERPPLS